MMSLIAGVTPAASTLQSNCDALNTDAWTNHYVNEMYISK